MREKTRSVSLLTALVAGLVMALALPAHATPPAPTTTALVSSANPSTPGQAPTLTATVTGSSPTGQVTFSTSGTPVATVALVSGSASLALDGWAPGTYTVVADYSGDGANDVSSTSIVQTVSAAPAPPAPAPAPKPAKPVKHVRVHLSASTETASVGDRIVLRWRTKHAESAVASGDWAGAQAMHGSKKVRIGERGKHVFRLTAANSRSTKTVKVVVMASRKAKTLELVTTEELVLVGTKVEVTADGLATDETYTVKLDGKPVASGRANKKGDVATSFVLAKTTKEGARALTITGSNPRRLGTTVLNVIAPKTLGVKVADDQVVRKRKQTVTVTGLAAGEEVVVVYGGERLVKAVADATGSFTYEFSVGTKTGERTVKVFGSVPSRVGEATFTVTDKNGTSTGGGGGGPGQDVRIAA